MSFNKWQNKKTSSSKTQENDLVSTVFLEQSPTLPLVYKCNVPNMNLSLWYQKNEQEVKNQLAQYGAVLFRGFSVHNQDDFNEFVEHSIKQTANYVEGATPRTKLGKGVYTATEFPSDQEISLHNELSYVTTPPNILAFCCLKAPTEGGQTHLADISKVFNRLDEKIITEFEQRDGWLLRRNYGNGFGPTIEKAFGMTDIEDIKAYGDKVSLKITQQSGNIIVTEQVRSAVHRHPQNDKKLWFNHISFWHPSSLCPKVKAKMEEMFTLAEFPYGTYFGDGTVIDNETVDVIRRAYREEEVQFDWREGDVLLLDNWQVAHGRKPFKGERKIIVAMG
jgi:hypothetical protein